MRVLVTRSEPGASETAQRLLALGFKPLVLPLTKIVPLPVEMEPVPAHAIAVTSANAIRRAPEGLLAEIAGKPVFAVGERTGAEARRAGLKVIDEDAGDAERLARHIDAAFPAPCHVTVLCGRVRRGVLETRLREAGHRVRVVETYDTLPYDPPDAEIAASLGEGGIDAVLVHSINGAEQLRRLAARSTVGAKLAGATYYCLSRRIADAMVSVAPERKRIAVSPTEESLLALFEEDG
ncbi:uroporphyrinogen-III synthase [Nitratireductor sp. ZSWI3]|uniref:uroporphyrinogen-III synthase n=1 Tax=Nitratireductor sp. ZSWI3 TaxID=2966359 RepID=UPI00215055CD|nr:uroporphyrinogen-III synthase [Nitratireductor sp. ZSWI3]MCR4267228.1 uroporphyrinogen-III synthase [Nitratireductor sp. ZSWI3]